MKISRLVILLLLLLVQLIKIQITCELIKWFNRSILLRFLWIFGVVQNFHHWYELNLPHSMLKMVWQAIYGQIVAVIVSQFIYCIRTHTRTHGNTHTIEHFKFNLYYCCIVAATLIHKMYVLMILLLFIKLFLHCRVASMLWLCYLKMLQIWPIFRQMQTGIMGVRYVFQFTSKIWFHLFERWQSFYWFIHTVGFAHFPNFSKRKQFHLKWIQ